jgi:hypothetical protein
VISKPAGRTHLLSALRLPLSLGIALWSSALEIALAWLMELQPCMCSGIAYTLCLGRCSGIAYRSLPATLLRHSLYRFACDFVTAELMKLAGEGLPAYEGLVSA